MNKLFLRIKLYFEESWRELKKVNWPTRLETIKRTGEVLFLAAFVAIVLGLVDYGLLQLMKLVIK
jgi:preprotein translocase subunit SecE